MAAEATKAAADGRPPRDAARAALDLLGWPARRLALALGEHPATVKRFLDGERDLPGVEAWLDLVSAPLRRHPRADAPGPDVSARDVPEPAMDGAGLREVREAMRWTRRDVAARSRYTDAAIERMERDSRPVPEPLARWLRAVSGPILAHPLPAGWEPRHAFVRPAPGRPALPRALPGNAHRRAAAARAAAQREARQGREAARAERGRLREEGEKRRLLVREQMARATPEERRRLAAERARRAVALHERHGKAPGEIGWELGITRQAVEQILAPRPAPDPPGSGPASGTRHPASGTRGADAAGR